ncbi:MAG: carboxypeptidase regulatory-like domain-containing protein [Methanomassiliicoccales archaeon]|nr:carboxypeptidase regulatory-like domain-containing protein [Methanomassiliicoccales archaeon]
MATKKEGVSRPTDRQRSSSLSDLSRALKGSWIGRNWRTALLLVMLVFLALFVRSYFGFSTSVDNGYLVSGGSDSYYHMRVIDHAVGTGEHLVWDDMLNYPLGMRNPRPPLYDWSVAVFAMFLSSISGLVITDAVGLSLVFSTAVWGALTVIPVYMLGKAAFGRKAGLLGAFIFALMAGHIERTVLSNADHDAMVLFFVVFSFYFLLRSLQSVQGSRWVARWGDPKAIGSGLKGYLGTNHVSLIYAALGGISVAAVAMIWTGYTYLLIIILVYLIVQLFVDRFRNADSMGVLFTIITLFGVAFLVMAPMYVSLSLVNTWFDTPLFLFIVATLGGLLFVVTRDYPWTLVLPTLAIITLGALAALSVLSPGLFESIVTGQGYLVKSKLYSTISEAQAPGFSSLAMSFGMVTFWLSLMGVGWAAYKIPKNISPYFIFVVVWVGISIYMASSAARFVFNAAPAFAVSAGWILAIIIDTLRFDEMLHSMRTDHGGLLKTLRHSVKIRHVLGIVFVVLMIMVPNVWYAMDAGIPSTSKADFDGQIYMVMPEFLRPDDYDLQNGTLWYLGAFAYGMSLPNTYWPAAWEWFSQQDSDALTPTDRPAFLSWWDYGFEAIQQGGHPAVADNFQNGYQFAGTFLMTQTEEGAIAMLIVRCMEARADYDSEALYSLMGSYGVDSVRLKDIMTHPTDYVEEVRDNPDVYGEYDDELSSGNAKYAAAREVLSRIGKGELTSLYHEVREITGQDIGYVAIDNRLFPFTATSYNIFYAPAKLSDQRVDGNNIPYDYYQIYAVDYYGEQIPLDEVTSSDFIVDYEIVYTEAFYDTMLYRTFMGYGPSDVGETEQGLPGISGSLQSLPSMQGWNMSNFRMVYRTAYYNPYPSSEVSNHSDAWRAISYQEGIELYGKINSGEVIGTVDLSSSGLYSGVVFLQYYDGAIIEGTALSDSGDPMANIWVTVLDDYGIPHQVVRTDADGRYSILAPFGETTVVFSYGDLDERLLYGTELYSTTLDITYDQAMRVEEDANKDGQMDYMVDLDVTITAGTLEGMVYVDNDGNGKYSASNDEVLVGATVIFENQTSGHHLEAVSTEDGYQLTGVPPISGDLSVRYDGHIFGEAQVTAVVDSTVTTDLGYEPAKVEGNVTLEDGSPANGVSVILLDQSSGEMLEEVTDASGAFVFSDLLPGDYTLQTPDGTVLLDPQVRLEEGDSLVRDLVLYHSMRITGLVSYDGEPITNAMVGVNGELGTKWVRSDTRGRYTVVVPKGQVSLYATATVEGEEVVQLHMVQATDDATIDLLLEPGMVLNGLVSSGTSISNGATVTIESRTSEAVLTAVSNGSGGFRAVLPEGLYSIYAQDGSRSYWNDIYLGSTVSVGIDLLDSVKVSGTAWYDQDGDGAISSGERLSGVQVSIRDQEGRALSSSTGPDGAYSFLLIAGRSYTLQAVKYGYEGLSETLGSMVTDTTLDLNMQATERLVSGSISSGMGGITIQFTARSGSAMDAVAVTAIDGSFSVTLSPGDYLVHVNQNVTPGDASVQYQSSAPMELTVDIGSDVTGLELEMVQRVLVTGTISPSGSAIMVFDGPEHEEISAGSIYSVYLQKGNYSLYVRVDNSSLRSADLSRVLISGPTVLDVAADTARQVMVRASMTGVGESGVIISIREGDACYNLTSSSSMNFISVYLAPGSYSASIEHHDTAVIDGVNRYVVYRGEISFEMGSMAQNVLIPTTRELDNATVQGWVLASGAPVPATLRFMPQSETAMECTVEAASGNYSVSLAPGNYSVYALSADSGQAFLGELSVDGPVDLQNDLVLSAALRLTGVTFAGDFGVQAQVTVAGEGALDLISGADGRYEIYLPAGTYLLQAETQLTEAGLSVTYSGENGVELQDVTSRGIFMEKEVVRSVDITWDSAQKATIGAGETAVYTIRVSNTGNAPDTLRLSATATGWTVTFSQTEVALDFGSGVSSQIVTVHLTPSESVLVSHTAVTVRVSSTGNSSITDTVKLDADISPFYELSLTYVSAQGTDGSDYQYRVKVKNQGNVEDTCTVTVGNGPVLNDLGWEVKLVDGTLLSDSLNLTVTASGSMDFIVSLTPLRQNPSPTVTVQLVAVSQNDEAAMATLDLTPEFAGLMISGGVAVSGPGVSYSAPAMGMDTVVLLGAALALMVVVLVLSVQKGVFSRRRR